MPKLFGMSLLIEILGILAMIFIEWDYSWLFLLSGFLYFMLMFVRYRNSNARHSYETETKKSISNLRKVDNFIQSKKGLTNSMMNGANNKQINGQSMSSQILDSFSGQSISNNVIDSFTNSSSIANLIKDNIDKKGGK